MIKDYEKNQPSSPIATVGLPLALHYYDQMPLWATFFKELGFAVKFSETSTRETYYKGNERTLKVKALYHLILYVIQPSLHTVI